MSTVDHLQKNESQNMYSNVMNVSMLYVGE